MTFARRAASGVYVAARAPQVAINASCIATARCAAIAQPLFDWNGCEAMHLHFSIGYWML